jgi:hypothetical protein
MRQKHTRSGLSFKFEVHPPNYVEELLNIIERCPAPIPDASAGDILPFSTSSSMRFIWN